MSQGLQKKNHYVPEMIIKHFTNDDKKIYQFDKNKLEWNNPNSNTDGQMTKSGVGKLNYLYIYQDENGNLNDGMEKALSKVENDAAKIVDKIIDHEYQNFFTNLENVLTFEEFNELIAFLALGLSRVPKSINGFTKFISDVALQMLEVEKHYGGHSQPIDLDKIKIQFSNNLILSTIFDEQTTLLLGQQLMSYSWVVLNNNTRFNFLLNDAFINFKHYGLSHPKNRLYIPLSKNKILIGCNHFNPEDLEIKFNELIINKKFKLEEIVKECNIYTIYNAYEYIYSPKKNDSIKNLILKNATILNNTAHYDSVFVKEQQKKIIINKPL